MAVAAVPYGTYSPQAIDPFPIEQTLAGIVGTNNPAEAANMLDTYQIKNMVSQDQYNEQLAQQHAANKQALQQQLYEANLKAVGETKDNPAALQILASSPQYAGVFGNMDPNAIGDLIQRARLGQDATTGKNVGEGISAARAGGAASDLTGINRQYGMNLTPVDPTQVEAARLRANAQIAAAGIRAGQDKNTMNIAVNTGMTDPTDNQPVKGIVKVPLNNPVEAQRRVDAGRSILNNSGFVPGSGMPGAPPPPNSYGLPLAPQATPAAGAGRPASPAAVAPAANAATPPAPPPDTPAGKYENWSTPAGVKLQGLAAQYLPKLPQDQQDDVTNAMKQTGGNIPLVIRGGRAYYVGTKRQLYSVGQ